MQPLLSSKLDWHDHIVGLYQSNSAPPLLQSDKKLSKICKCKRYFSQHDSLFLMLQRQQLTSCISILNRIKPTGKSTEGLRRRGIQEMTCKDKHKAG